MNDRNPGANYSRMKSNSGALGVMSIAVVLQVAGAVVLKTLADHRLSIATVSVLAGIAGVLVLNLARLAVWGWAHRLYPLSSTYPLSSLFYPAILVVANAFGDTIGSRQIFGALLITAGSVWLTLMVDRDT